MITEGIYPAKIIGAGLSANKSGAAQCYLRFEAITDSGPEEIIWYGQLSTEKSTAFSVKALVTAGFIGKDFDQLDMPIEAVFETKKLTITIENGDNGKPQVKFINVKGSGQQTFTGVVPKEAGLFAKCKADLGVKATASTKSLASDDLAF